MLKVTKKETIFRHKAVVQRPSMIGQQVGLNRIISTDLKTSSIYSFRTHEHNAKHLQILSKLSGSYQNQHFFLCDEAVRGVTIGTEDVVC